jgi:hypothetical protein
MWILISDLGIEKISVRSFSIVHLPLNETECFPDCGGDKK